MSISLTLQQKLNLLLSPSMLLLRNMLHMDSLELEQFLKDAAVENPFLEIETVSEKLPAFQFSKQNWLRKNDKQNRSITTEDTDDTDDPLFFVADEHTVDIHTYLFATLASMKIHDELRRALSILITYIEVNGRLETPLEYIAAKTHLLMEDLEQALNILQHLEPIGMGARSLSECLLLQLEAIAPQNHLAKQLVKEHLDLLGRGKDTLLAKRLGVPVSEIQQSLSLIRTLDPFPAAVSPITDNAPYIVEDLVAVPKDDHFDILLRDDLSSRVHLNTSYVEAIPHTTGADHQWLVERHRAAQALQEHVITRNQLLLVCAHYLFDHQPEYIRDTASPLRPLTLTQASTDLGLHISVLSRLINGKYVRIGHQLVALRSFFSREIPNSSGGCTPSYIKQIMREVLDHESPSSPYSDQKICQELEKKGIYIARRTVAKYREELGIPTMGERKRRQNT